MTVTAITEVSKSKSKIYLDHEFAFVLYKGELRIFHIHEGSELQQADYDQIMQEILPKRAKLRCMNLLKSRSYTRSQLSDKLQQGLYPTEIIEAALSYVESYGYVNDEQYARDFIEYNQNQKSKNKICNDLIRKGISTDLISRIWDEAVSGDSGELEQEQILKLITKKNFNKNTANVQEKQRMFAFLYRKGFQIDAIKRALLLDIT